MLGSNPFDLEPTPTGPFESLDHTSEGALARKLIGAVLILVVLGGLSAGGYWFLGRTGSRPVDPTPAPGPLPPQIPSPGAALTGDSLTVPPLADVIAAVDPTVLRIISYRLSNALLIPHEQGSGVLYDADGYLITNAHVINYGDQGKTEAYLSGARPNQALEAEIIGIDPCHDLAVLRIPGGPYPVAPHALPLQLNKGEDVIAMGYGLNDILSANEPSSNAGIVSRLGVNIPPFSDLIQHQAPSNPGSSGGPLFNRAGFLVGINTLGITENGSQGLFFAINIEQVEAVWQELRYGRPASPDNTQSGLIGQPFHGYMRGTLDRQCWTYRLEADRTVSIRVSASSPVEYFDPELWVYGPDHLLVGHSDNASIITAAELEFVADQTGMYTITINPELRTTLQGVTGEYELLVTTD